MGPVTQSPDPSATNLPGLSVSPFFPYFFDPQCSSCTTKYHRLPFSAHLWDEIAREGACCDPNGFSYGHHTGKASRLVCVRFIVTLVKDREVQNRGKTMRRGNSRTNTTDIFPYFQGRIFKQRPKSPSATREPLSPPPASPLAPPLPAGPGRGGAGRHQRQAALLRRAPIGCVRRVRPAPLPAMRPEVSGGARPGAWGRCRGWGGRGGARGACGGSAAGLRSPCGASLWERSPGWG